mgnify:CR=1 FL=1
MLLNFYENKNKEFFQSFAKCPKKHKQEIYQMKAKGYSLWFVPSGSDYYALKDEIKKLSDKFKAPVFEPHITLLGEIEEEKDEMIKKAFTLTSRIKPFEVELNNICSGENYFQKLFYLTNKPKELILANEKAKEIFKRQNDPLYVPHLSLLYSLKAKPEHIKEIPRNLSLKFNVNYLVLIDANGFVNEWHKIKEFPLK